jgi:hypothetical protein
LIICTERSFSSSQRSLRPGCLDGLPGPLELSRVFPLIRQALHGYGTLDA